MNNFTELEYKYVSHEIKLNDFIELMKKLSYKEKLEISSWDHYYTCLENRDESIRFRDSCTPELTLKRKVSQNNNWKRVEIDLPLDPNRINEETVDAWTKLEGYGKKTKLYKTCFIYWFENVNIVYYIVFDHNMTEKGRYIEIESNKDNKLSEEDSFQEIKKYEQELGKLGISPQNRLKRSLFELYVKE